MLLEVPVSVKKYLEILVIIFEYKTTSYWEFCTKRYINMEIYIAASLYILISDMS